MIKEVSLSTICDIQSGGTPSRSNSRYWGGDILWSKISDIEKADGIITKTEEHITNEGLIAIRNRIFSKGTLLFAMYGSIGKTAIAGTKLATNQAILGITINNKNVLDMSYLRHWLRSQQQQFMNDSKGVAQKNLSAGYIRDLIIPLLPLEKQKRIADILDKADALRQKRQQTIELADQFLRSLFLDMFGDPVKNPKCWEEPFLKEHLEFLTSGSRGWAKHYSKSGSKFLRIQNIGSNELLLEDIAYVKPPSNAEAKRTKTKPGDILITITADLGRTAVIPDDIGPTHINQHLALVRVKDINALYVSAFLASSGGQKQFQQMNKVGVKSGLNFNDIRELRLLRPPRKLQDKFALIWTRVNKKKESLKDSLHLTEQIIGSLTQRAFRGEL